MNIRGIIVAVIIVLGILTYTLAFQPNYLPQAVAKYHDPVRTYVDKGFSLTNQVVDNVKSSQLKPFGEVVHTSELVAVDEDKSKNLPQKAFEYGRYQYCQQVVREYEQLYSSESTSEANLPEESPSPSPSEE